MRVTGNLYSWGANPGERDLIPPARRSTQRKKMVSYPLTELRQRMHEIVCRILTLIPDHFHNATSAYEIPCGAGGARSRLSETMAFPTIDPDETAQTDEESDLPIAAYTLQRYGAKGEQVERALLPARIVRLLFPVWRQGLIGLLLIFLTQYHTISHHLCVSVRWTGRPID